jgi:O-antigen ligase
MALMLPGWRKLYVLVLGCGLGLLAGVLVPGLLGTLFKLFANAADDPSVQGRTEDYPLVWLEVANHPWFGRGFGTYFPDRYILLDNQYLGTLVENGYVGLACFIGLILAGVVAALRTHLGRRSPVIRSLGGALFAAILVGATGAATFDMMGFPQAALLLVGLVGLAGAALRAALDEKRAGSATPSELGQA